MFKYFYIEMFYSFRRLKKKCHLTNKKNKRNRTDKK